jgi:hypothetical protein
MEYKKIYPRHKQSDGIEKALWLKCTQQDNQWREARMAEVEGGSASAKESSLASMKESSLESNESMESILEGFSPAHSEDCEDGINVYNGDGEVEGNSKWEDSDGETSSNESGDGESENMGSKEEDGEGSDNDSQNRSDVEMDEDISD